MLVTVFRAGLWEFPGGKVDPGETPEAALIRELREYPIPPADKPLVAMLRDVV